MNPHPDANRLRLWYDGCLSDAESQEIETHLKSCYDSCQPLLDRLAISQKHPEFSGPGVGPDGAAEMPSLPGYELISQIGRGGMGVVYKGRHVELNRLVALKMVRSGPRADLEARAATRDIFGRFRKEARIASQLQHPGIPPVYELGELQNKRP